ncbi:MAG TPA: GerMN domain-containing protein [Vicinamibacterales bacterium]|nr:GerMN domain-containing protein [Vicinamibacterales bacterium]
MTGRNGLLIGGSILFAILIIATVLLSVEKFVPPRRAESTPPAAVEAPTATAHITATLFYMGPDGRTLLPVRREIPVATLAEVLGAQILSELFAPAPPPYVSVIPKGTTLRAFYITNRGDAFVDLSPEVSTAHPGGTVAELLTVYAIVNAVTANLPSVQRVQILVDGKEVDTIAGHIDVRRPLARDGSLVKGT